MYVLDAVLNCPFNLKQFFSLRRYSYAVCSFVVVNIIPFTIFVVFVFYFSPLTADTIFSAITTLRKIARNLFIKIFFLTCWKLALLRFFRFPRTARNQSKQRTKCARHAQRRIFSIFFFFFSKSQSTK